MDCTQNYTAYLYHCKRHRLYPPHTFAQFVVYVHPFTQFRK